MPKISVSLTTKRTGGIDVAKYSLLRQTFKDYELILVDELYEKRHDAVESYFKGSGINLVHINASKEGHPVWKPWDFTVVRSHNLALTHARGEVLVLCDDYWVLNPDALEATWKAWEAWGKRGVNVNLFCQAKHAMQIKPSFRNYAIVRMGAWSTRGGSDNLEAPPDTHISIYAQDFNANPGIERTSNDGVRLIGEVRDPRPDDPPEVKSRHIGAAGRFKYWLVNPSAVWGHVVPVEDAVKLNGWNHIYNGYWGHEGEINIRLAAAFGIRYTCTASAVADLLPHPYWGNDSPRVLGKYNFGFAGSHADMVEKKMKAGDFWADNPFNIAEERRNLKDTGKTNIFKY